MQARRSYSSPLRSAHTEDTRERILAATYTLLGQGDADDVTIDMIAAEAGIQKRTIFRHFENREALFDAFWVWLNRKLDLSTLPQTAEDLVAGPKTAFPRFDEADGVIRASIHSPSGRAMRVRATAARRDAFAAALASHLSGVEPAAAQRAEALAHLLYSAPAWEVLKDYGGMTGTQAGYAAAWALDLILSAISSGEKTKADVSSERTGE